MRIGTITWLYNMNYGTVLQAYALNRIINEMGFDNYVINYKKNNLSKLQNYMKYKNSSKLIKEKAEYLKAASVCKDPELRKLKTVRFHSFIKEKIKLTTEYRSPKDLRRDREEGFDVYLSGSDQIWNPTLFNPTYFFDYLPEEKKKIAYAASFGVNDIRTEKVRLMKPLLDRFSHISFREEKGKELAEEKFALKSQVVLDPTLLLEKNEWIALCGEVKRETHRYILCYFLNESKEYWRHVRRIQKKIGCKVLVIPVLKDSFQVDYERATAAGPIEWIRLIADAAFVCTDSYHCELFSIMFHKNFFIMQRFVGDDFQSQDSRICNISKMLDLEERVVDCSYDICLDNLETPEEKFENADKILVEKRHQSIMWLRDAIMN